MKNQQTAPGPQPDAPPEVKALREHVSTLLRLFLINEKVFPSAGGQASYSVHEFQTIGFVAHHPGCMASTVAGFLGVAPTTMTSLLDRLVKRGLVHRERPETNRRAVALTLTVEGDALFQAILTQDYANMIAMLAALDDAERPVFLRCMDKIAGRIGAAARG
jgi:DNA-binding MarR family transcriptional regulator